MLMDIKIESLDDKRLEMAFALATDTFTQESTLHRAMDIQLSEYQDYLRNSFKKIVTEGLSIAAIDAKSGDLIGCLIATEFLNQLDSSVKSSIQFAPLVALTNSLATKYDSQRSIVRGEAVLVDMGVVSAHARGNGIYKLMRLAIEDVARRAGYRWVIGELSSAATQHVVINRMKYRVMAQIKYDEFEFEGGYPFQFIKEPPSIVISGGDL